MNRTAKRLPKECNKDHCMKEVNRGTGHYLGTPFVKEDFWLACYLCEMNLGEEAKEE